MSLASDFGVFILGLMLLLILVVGMFIVERLQRLLDRYRLKYGFDREIERKECGKEDTEHKLDSREKYFKRRTYKD